MAVIISHPTLEQLCDCMYQWYLAGGNILVQGSRLQELLIGASFSFSSYPPIHNTEPLPWAVTTPISKMRAEENSIFSQSGSGCTVQASQGKGILLTNIKPWLQLSYPGPGAVVAKLTARLRTGTQKDTKTLCKAWRWWGGGLRGIQMLAQGLKPIPRLLSTSQEKGHWRLLTFTKPSYNPK